MTGILAGVAAILAVYALVDPRNVWMPHCPVKMLTGMDCPGCGSQRMLHALLHGDLVEAWHCNALLMVLLPWLALMAALEIWRQKFPRLYRFAYSTPVMIALCVIIVAWTIIRNLT